MRAGVAFALVFASLGVAFASGEPRLLVSAASSLLSVLEGLEPAAEAVLGARIELNAASSGALMRQIEAGAPVDIFLSAGAEELDRLEAAGRLVPGSRRSIAGGSLVLVARGGGRSGGAEEPGRRIRAAATLAIGDPAYVPAGRHAAAALAALGLTEAVEGKLVLCGSAVQALRAVESGAAELGLVFASDALRSIESGRLSLVHRFPKESQRPPILYAGAVLARAADKELGTRLLAFLGSAEASRAFAAAGFSAP